MLSKKYYSFLFTNKTLIPVLIPLISVKGVHNANLLPKLISEFTDNSVTNTEK